MNELMQISCPECGSPIDIETQLLLQGVQFTCTNCEISISLSKKSRPTVEASYKELEKLKNQNQSL